MSLDTRLAAFVEYVVRPLSEDWRLILDRIVELRLPITPDLIRHITRALGMWHIVGEVIRAVSYVIITWMICQTVQCLLPLSSSR